MAGSGTSISRPWVPPSSPHTAPSRYQWSNHNLLLPQDLHEVLIDALIVLLRPFPSPPPVRTQVRTATALHDRCACLPSSALPHYHGTTCSPERDGAGGGLGLRSVPFSA